MTKSGRVYFSALSVPAEGDPRWADIDDALAKVDELAAETAATASAAPKTLDEIAPAAWARFNAAGKGTRR